MHLLGTTCPADKYYVEITEAMRANLRSSAGGHLWRGVVSAYLINNYATFRINSNSRYTSYLNWTVMTSAHLMSFGVVRLIISCMESLSLTLKQIAALFLCRDKK
jgi:hypothetical protein